MTTTTLPDSDLHAMFTLLEDARRDEPGDVVPWALLEGLGRLIRADSVQLCELDWVHECLVQKQDIDEGERGAITTVTKDDETASYFRVSRNFLACTDPAWSDPGWRHPFLRLLHRPRVAHHRGLLDFYRHGDVRTCLGVRLPCPPGRARRVMFVRSTTNDFTDRDVMVLTLLRPHLEEIYLDAERRRQGAPKSPRASGRSCSWPVRACPTPRSGNGCSSRQARCASTWSTSSTHWGCTPAPRPPRSHCRTGCSSRASKGYLRVYMAQLRRRLEPDPARPRYPLTEPGMGYRMAGE